MNNMNKEDLNITSGFAEANSKVMTMTTHQRNVKFYIAGAATVNWGDGLESNTNTYKYNYDEEENEYCKYSFKHKYSDKGTAHMIIIQDANIMDNEQ